MLRLNAHAYVQSEQTRDLIRQAMTDRRLAKLVPALFSGGLAAARARYANEPSAPLLIVETGAAGDGRQGDDGGDLLPQVDALAEVCEPGTNLILLGAANDIEIYRALTRRGVADYLVVPTTPGRLVESILDLYRDPAKTPAGQSIAFVGAKGGCGSSTLAHNAAFALAHAADCEVTVIDLDLPFGCADLSFNAETALGIRNVLADPERIDEVFLQRFSVKYGDRVQVLAASPTLDGDTLIDLHALETAIEAIKHHSRYVVLDLPHVWTEWVRATLRQADAVVVTTTPDLAGLRNVRHMVDFLSAHRPMEASPTLVLNRVGAAKKGEVSPKDFAQTVGLSADLAIPEDTDAFGLAAANGKMVQEVRPRAKSAEAIRQLAARLVRRDAPGKGAPGKGKAKADTLSLLRLFKRAGAKG